MSQPDLTGRRAIVVGAEFPAGAAIARACAEAGADVAVCSLTADEAVMRSRAVKRAIEATGRRSAEYVMDVMLGKNVQVTMRQVVKEMGGVDVVVSAPDLVFAKPIDRTTDMELARVMQVNFASQFFVVRAAADEFRRAHHAGCLALVTGASDERTEGDPGDTAAYDAARAAVDALARSAARELAGERIAVAAIALGRDEALETIGAAVVRLAGASLAERDRVEG